MRHCRRGQKRKPETKGRASVTAASRVRERGRPDWKRQLLAEEGENRLEEIQGKAVSRALTAAPECFRAGRWVVLDQPQLEIDSKCGDPIPAVLDRPLKPGLLQGIKHKHKQTKPTLVTELPAQIYKED